MYPFREETYTLLCVVCKDPSSWQCKRCASPRCSEHTGKHTCCDECENIFRQQIQGLGSKPRILEFKTARVWVVCGCGATLVLTTLGKPLLACGIGVMAILYGFELSRVPRAIWARQWEKKRAVFLEERKQPRLPKKGA